MVNVPASFDWYYCATMYGRTHKKVLMCGTLLRYVDSTLCGQIKNLSGGLEITSLDFSLDDLPLRSWK